jgi:hypothetical protein
MSLVCRVAAVCLVLALAQSRPAVAGVTTTAIRETAELILKKFGKGAAGETAEQIASKTTKVLAKHGDESLVLLRRCGHAGFEALEQAGEQAPEVVKLFAKRGDDAAWIISEPRKLALFLKHGDTAADALLKHPGIADDLIEKYGVNASQALSRLSRAPSQQLSMMAADGTLDAMPQKNKLLAVVAKYGDRAMDFVWRNKGSLAVASVLATFLSEPETYISGARQLIADPVLKPIAEGTNWTAIILACLAVLFLPFIVFSITKGVAQIRRAANSGRYSSCPTENANLP